MLAFLYRITDPTQETLFMLTDAPTLHKVCEEIIELKNIGFLDYMDASDLTIHKMKANDDVTGYYLHLFPYIPMFAEFDDDRTIEQLMSCMKEDGSIRIEKEV